MDTAEKKIPRFRSVKRLVNWVDRNGRERLDASRERLFFTTKKESPHEVAHCVARYAMFVGPLGPELEALLAPNHDSIVSYVINMKSKWAGASNGEEYAPAVVDELAGDSRRLCRVAQSIGRLPEHLENTIDEPRCALIYATDVLKGRLPRHLEDVFFKDTHYAAKYAFEVIRGFSSARLPDELHSFMVMKSFEKPDDEDIRTYMEATESDPNKIGNSTETV
jgi:hypothetical protein